MTLIIWSFQAWVFSWKILKNSRNSVVCKWLVAYVKRLISNLLPNINNKYNFWNTLVYATQGFVSMSHTFLPSLLQEMTVYSYSFFSFTTLNKDNVISLIPKEMSSGVHAFQCRTDKQHDKIIASPACSLIHEKLHFKQGWLCLATAGCLHELL